MLYNVIDIGSNTVKSATYEIVDGKLNQIDGKSIKCSLGLFRTGGILNRDGVRRLKTVLAEFALENREREAVTCMIFATASLRGLLNTEALVEKLFLDQGMFIDVIDGIYEAGCSYRALRYEFPDVEKGAMADMGGGSTELVYFDETGIRNIFSMPFGSLSIRSEIGISVVPTADQEEKIFDYISSVCNTKQSDVLYTVGGTARAIFKLCNLGNTVSFSTLESFYDQMKKLPHVSEMLESLVPDRAEFFLAGCYAYICICKLINAKELRLCKYGAREGYLLKRLNL